MALQLLALQLAALKPVALQLVALLQPWAWRHWYYCRAAPYQCAKARQQGASAHEHYSSCPTQALTNNEAEQHNMNRIQRR